MLAYKFYLRDPIRGLEFIDILPERRRRRERITHESVIKLGRKLLGRKVKQEDIFFVEMVVEDREKREHFGRGFPRMLLFSCGKNEKPRFKYKTNLMVFSCLAMTSPSQFTSLDT